MFNIPFWFCCLNPVERQVMRATANAFLLTGYAFIPLNTWRSFWIPLPPSSGARQSAFIALYLMQVVTGFPLPSGGTATVVIPTNVPFWIAVQAYALTPSGACVGGCSRWFPD